MNAHRLTGADDEARRILNTVTYSYLGDWIERQRADQRDGEEGADGRLAGRIEEVTRRLAALPQEAEVRELQQGQSEPFWQGQGLIRPRWDVQNLLTKPLKK